MQPIATTERTKRTGRREMLLTFPRACGPDSADLFAYEIRIQRKRYGVYAAALQVTRKDNVVVLDIGRGIRPYLLSAILDATLDRLN